MIPTCTYLGAYDTSIVHCTLPLVFHITKGSNAQGSCSEKVTLKQT